MISPVGNSLARRRYGRSHDVTTWFESCVGAGGRCVLFWRMMVICSTLIVRWMTALLGWSAVAALAVFTLLQELTHE
jgi:hypothetical protein